MGIDKIPVRLQYVSESVEVLNLRAEDGSEFSLPKTEITYEIAIRAGQVITVNIPGFLVRRYGL